MMRRFLFVVLVERHRVAAHTSSWPPGCCDARFVGLT